MSFPVSFAGGMSPPPIPVVRGWISMLSHHYPERMGKAIAINVPWILNQVRFGSTASVYLLV